MHPKLQEFVKVTCLGSLSVRRMASTIIDKREEQLPEISLAVSMNLVQGSSFVPLRLARGLVLYV